MVVVTRKSYKKRSRQSRQTREYMADRMGSQLKMDDKPQNICPRK